MRAALVILFSRTVPALLLAACIPNGQAADAGEIAALRRQLAAQEKQIDELRAALAEQRQLLDRLSAPGAVAAAPAAAAPAPPPQSMAGRESTQSLPAPLALHIGSAEFTPGGFLDFTSIYRSTNVGSGIGTAFGSIPFNDTTAGRLSESRFSAQNSRLSLKVATQVGQQHVTGYVEADFLGIQPPNIAVSSNSNSFRMRQYWADVRRGNWEVLGGQAWSLMTPNRKGVLPLPSDVFNTEDMDTNYQAGLIWSRDPGVRVIYHASPRWTAAVALENPQQYITPAVALPAPAYGAQLDNGSNPAVPNPRPDLIAKLAYDGQWNGRAVHLEAAGLSRSFRVLRANGSSSSIAGAGGSLNGNLEVARNLRLLVNTYYSSGGGRYIFGLGPDVVLRPDGTLSPVHAASTVSGFEYQVTPASMWYGYYGGAYFQRNYAAAANGTLVGFGFPGGSNGANRSVQEGTFGLIRTFWKNDRHGTLQLITQYSYLWRNPWWVAAGTPDEAHTHMFYSDLRFVLP